MTQWLLRTIGISDELVADIHRIEWAWARPDWLVLGLILLAPAAWFIVRRHRVALGHISPRPRAVLSVCRIVVLLLLVLVLGGPYVKIEQRVERKPLLAVVIDESASMSLPAGPFDDEQTRRLARAAGLLSSSEDAEQSVDESIRAQLDEYDRAALLHGVLSERADDLLPELAKRFDVQYYSVARRGRELDGLADTGELDPFDRGETALGSVLEQVVEDASGRQIAGIMLLTDGRSTIGIDPVQAMRRIGADGDSDNPRAPVWSVPVGSATAAADLMVLDASAPSRVGRGDSVSVLTTLRAQVIEADDVTVRLVQGEQTLDEQQVDFSDEGRRQVELSFEADQPGQHMLKVVIDPDDRERVTENNEQFVSIRVDDDRVKLLYLEGAPRWDFRFLDHGLRRDQGIEVRFVMEQQLRVDGVSAADLPAAAGLSDDPEDFAEYDAILLGDVSADMLDEGVMEALIEAVEEEGVGLLVQAGTEHMPHAYLETPLAEVLPMRFEPHGESRIGGIEADAFAPFRMGITATGAMHPALALYGSATRNRELWGQMPVFYWAAAATEARSGATVLAEVTTSSSRRPLIASHFFGRGRVMFVGMDTTFRWRRNIGDHLFYRFWGQALRYVARDDDRSEDRSWLSVEPRQVEPGSPVTVELYAVDREGEPLSDQTLPMTLRTDDGEEPLELSRAADDQRGHYRAVWQPREPGLVDFVFDHLQRAPVTATVRVTDSGRELLHPTVDRDSLAALADLSGGGIVELDELQTLPGRLVGEAVTLHRSHEQQVWDNWLVLMMLVGLYCTDVAIRRLMGLN